MSLVSQTNTIEGPLVLPAKGDLTGKEGYLVEIINDSNVSKVQLPNANTDITPFVVVDGNTDGLNVTVLPLAPTRNARVRLKGTCAPGDILVLADVGTPADKGKVRALPATLGGYTMVGVAEEVGADGQLVLLRPTVTRQIRVGETHQIIASGVYSWAGGAATTAAITVTGAVSTDTVLCTLAAQASTELLTKAIAATDAVNLTLSANGTNGTTKVNYAVIRAL